MAQVLGWPVVCLSLLATSAFAAEDLIARLPPSEVHGAVLAVAYAPDGSWIALGSERGSLRLWQTATAKVVREVSGSKGRTNAVVFSPDSKLLAAAGEDKAVHLWNSGTWKELPALQGHEASIEGIAFAPHGKRLASLSKDKTLRLWDLASGKEVRRIDVGRGDARAVAFAPDGKLLATGGGVRERAVRLWDATTGNEVRQLRGHYNRVHCLAFSADGKQLFSGGRDQTIQVWDVATGQRLHEAAGYEGEVLALSVSRDGKTIISGQADHHVHVWETQTGKERRRFVGHEGRVLAVALSPDGKRIASGGEDGSFFLWDLMEQPGNTSSASPTAKRLAELWEDLAGVDASRAFVAIGQLEAAPQASLPYFAGRVKELVDATTTSARLIKELDDVKYAVRRQAYQDLDRTGEFAIELLQSALRSGPTLEKRLRIEQLLYKLALQQDSAAFSARRRALRVIEILEHIGTAEARRLLHDLAQGAPEARLQQEARAALDRLSMRNTLSILVEIENSGLESPLRTYQ
jgi:tricorn protease-like protein